VMRIHRFAAAAIVVTAVLGSTAACTGSSTGTGAKGGASGSATIGAAGSGGTSTSTPSGSSSATTSAADDGAETGVSACTGPELQVTIKSAGAAANHTGRVMIFTNNGSSACTMQGYPGVSVVNGSTSLLNATRTLSGFITDDPGIKSAPLVTVAPGQSASAMVEWAGNAGETCYANGTGTLEITPPNTRSTSSFGTLPLGDDGVCAEFQVHPVTSGILRYVN